MAAPQLEPGACRGDVLGPGVTGRLCTSTLPPPGAGSSWHRGATPRRAMCRRSRPFRPLVESAAAVAARGVARGASASGPALAGLAGVGLLERLDQLVLAHPRPAGDVELPGHLVEVTLAGVGVHATGGLAALARTGSGPRGLVVGRALLVLGLPMVADLLERVLQRRERRAVSPFPLAVLVHGRVVCRHPRVLRLLRRALQGGRQLLASWHFDLPSAAGLDY